MKTTDNIRGVVAELAQRELDVRTASIYLETCETRSEFIEVARAFAANDVKYGGLSLWASRQDGAVKVLVFAGSWWDEIAPAHRDAAVADLRREILTVVADDVAVPA